MFSVKNSTIEREEKGPNMGEDEQIKNGSPNGQKITLGSNGNDELTEIEKEKRLVLIKAWEDNEKARADTKAYKKICYIEAWENSQKATIEAELRSIEENLERKKAEYIEKFKSKIPEIQKMAEEKKAKIESQKGQDLIKVKETADKLRSTSNGYPPKKLCGCF